MIHSEPMKTFLTWTVTLVGAYCLFHSCEASASVRPVKASKARVIYGKGHGKDVALWLARSCVGEAGFSSGETGECSAILHVYRKRAKLTRFNLYQVVRRYSAAIKKGPHQKRDWVFHLNRKGTKPKNWGNLKWKVYKPRWIEILNLCDQFLKNEIPDPLPHADHYGGKMDRHRADQWKWFRLKTPGYSNYFWSVNDPKKKEKSI